ncbi:related to ATP-binding cassette transporter CGR1 [Saccharomycodes ludwigii]|uniref:Related to ATP-binding cassette transporter CGR1 n=1 Tax=Saccharomycodes ludwigii TaxID=36035 RepID=A0A376BAJ1_9ASCO|nr:related to ATP-binding cassette transporter CGR1 [Saccharomycodes ludwigii]
MSYTDNPYENDGENNDNCEKNGLSSVIINGKQEIDSSSSYSPIDQSNKFKGLDNQAENNIRNLARTFTNNSISQSNVQKSFHDNTDSNNNNSLYSDNNDAKTNICAFSDSSDKNYDPRLDPNSDKFSSVCWVQNLSRIMNNDPDYYKPYVLGCCYKNLRACGDSNDVSYQSTIGNMPIKILQFIYRHLRRKREGDTFDILKSMDGLIKPGELLVVLGRPGSGCTTLLKSISANTHGFSIDPESIISYEGLTPKEIKKHYRGDVVYNAEADIHFPHLTVYQTLNTVARLVTPRNRIKGVSREEFAKHITEVTMATYGLSHTRDTKVGDDFIRGVSGGERKRVSISEVSICGSKFQCWDNATRGLDSATSLEFVKALKTSADITNSSACVAIYQCSQDAYNLFNKVSVLSEGYQIFFGYGNRAKKYFEEMGYVSPARQTTADFLTAVTNPAERIINPDYIKRGIKVPTTAKEMEHYWKNSQDYKQLLVDIDDYLNKDETAAKEEIHEAHVSRQSKRSRPSSPYILNYNMQVRYLLIRNFQRIRNNMGLTLFTVIGNSAMALLLSSMFYKVMLHTTAATFYSRGASMFIAVLFNAFSSLLEIMSLFEARPIVEKHKRYALYHPSAEALSSVISELPSKAIVCLCFNIVFYFMVNYRRKPGFFFFFLLMNALCTLGMSHIFRCIGSASNSFPEAMVPACIFLLAMAMFAGFVIPKTKMLLWSKWIYWINPIQYIFESLMINEFHGREFLCEEFIPRGPGYSDVSLTNQVCSSVGAVAGESYVSGDRFLELAYGYLHKHKWRGFGVACAYAVFFLGVYLVFSEYNESAKQKGEVLVFPASVVRRMKKLHPKKKLDIESGGDNEKMASAPNKELVLNDSSNSTSSSNNEEFNLFTSNAIFHWRDVKYEVKIKNETKRILDGVDGWVKPGTLTALMGASGAGKTTLLDCLASRVTMGVITGNIFVDGHVRDNSFPRSIGYCQQQDLHLSTATVRESLRFSAYLRQPSSVSKQEKDEYVEEVIRILEMEQYADAVVGVAGEGLNVEQRKRLTVDSLVYLSIDEKAC